MIRIFFFLSFIIISSAGAAAPVWEGEVPAAAKDSEQWNSLLSELLEKQMFHGEMAAASRMLLFFTNVEVKENAYRGVINLVDQGYPFPVVPAFLAGDLTAAGDYNFTNNYNLYKYIINKDKGLEKWANHYLEGIDREKYPKFLLYDALETYGRGELKPAEEKLKKLLALDLGDSQLSFMRKAARSLARVYFDEKEYDKAFDIYSTFLLKLSPVQPSDWLESAWCLYYLKRYPEAIGMLYNLESKAAGSFVSLEKYTIRALSYRNLCQVDNAENLIASFDKDFGPIVQALKHGESVTQFPQLVRLEVPGNEMFRQIAISIAYLRYEMGGIKYLTKGLRPLAEYLYNSEIAMLTQRKKAYTDAALELAANRLIMTGEHLRFIRFDVQRERFNPDLVFAHEIENDDDIKSLEELSDSRYRIRWNQLGDFWRDERLEYIGLVPNACGQ